ncbi:hypothetical protein Dimus_011561 [Dionaea muscipula]
MSDAETTEPTAVGAAEAKYRLSMSKSSNSMPLFSIFSNIPLKLPFSKKQQKPDEDAIVAVSKFSAADELAAAKPLSVTFPRTSSQGAPLDLKLTDNESEDQGSSPHLVYALGGFLMLRWAWAKWVRKPDEADQ